MALPVCPTIDRIERKRKQRSARPLARRNETIQKYCTSAIFWYHKDLGPTFEWDEQKNQENQRKHGVAFEKAQLAFLDPKRVILRDAEHSDLEERYFLLGRTEQGILTVRFTWRDQKIRIIGAGYWRKGKRRYEQENSSS